MSSKLNFLTLAGEIVRVKIRTGLLTHKASKQFKINKQGSGRQTARVVVLARGGRVRFVLCAGSCLFLIERLRSDEMES
jgi:hypothetical protein